MPNLPKKLKSKLTKRIEVNALRKLPKETDLVDFASNDYLGFAKEVIFHHGALQLQADNNLIKNGSTGSRLLTGNHQLYKKLELSLVEFFDSESALVFNSGYDANIGFFSSVPQRDDIVFYDEFIHASIRDGINLGNAKSYRFKHNDLYDLKLKYETVLEKRNADEQTKNEIYIVTEAVFSMDGDVSDLMALTEFCSQNQLHLIVDEAHSVGVFGKNGNGLVSHLNIENQVFARIVTFGKAMGCHGAAILGGKDLIDYLINFARSFIYTTSLPPHAIASIITVLKFLNSDAGESRRLKLQEKIAIFKIQIEGAKLLGDFLQSDSAIQCLLVAGNENAKFVANKLQENGFDVKPILSPTVPIGKERLRFCLHSYNSNEEISDCLSILAKFN